jgi:phage terminase large subunit
VGVREIVIPYEPRNPFVPFHERDKRWGVLVCHRRAGKTVSAINELIRRAMECKLQRPRFAYIAPFREQAKRVAWDYLKYYSRPVWEDRPNESELSVRLLGDRKVMLFGADNADALRGIYLDGAVLDEFGDFRPSVWGNVIRPALSDRKGWAVFGGTPKGRNEFWTVRELARKNPTEWFFLELRASESGLLDQEEIEAARRQLTPDQFAQEFECDFMAALPGAYFGKEMVACDREGRITDVSVDLHLPVHTAWDIGFRDDTAIWFFQVIRDEIHVIDYHASSGQTIEYYTKLVSEKGYRYGVHWLPHDARAKTLASGGKSIVEQLAVGLDLKKLAIVPNLEVQDGIQAARKALETTWFDQTKCEEGIEALRQYQREYDEDKKAFRERPRHDWTSHPADAYRMLAVAWQKDIKPQEPKPLPIRGITVGHNTVTMDEMWKTAPQPSGRI